jgi:cytochrome c6
MKTKLITKAAIVSTLFLAWFGGRTQAADTRELWDKNCASCHGKDGRGDTKMGKKVEVKDYTDPKFQAEYKEDKGIKTIKEGITEKGKERMKAYADKFSDEEIKALAAHIGTFKKP